MKNINLNSFDLTQENVFQKDENTYLVTKWNWNYPEALAFQEACQKEVYANKKLKVFISTSHPHCFTMGRGLQKSKGKVIDGLVETSEEELEQLPFPVYHIRRGGGLTFHYPGQWIFYPIINLNGGEFNLSGLVNRVLANCISVLDDRDINTKSGELMGLWKGRNKIASVGVEINRFVTMHGTALSLHQDFDMFQALSAFNPCGLKAQTYLNSEQLLGKRIELDDFNEKFLALFFS